MKALVLTDYHKLAYQETEEPQCAPGEVIVSVAACGICGSDMHGMDGSTGRRRPPIIMGHEAAGVIVARGSAVAAWNIGDRVTFDSTVYCGECFFCRQGRVNLCDNRRVLGVSCAEYRRHGAFAERVNVPQHILYKLPDILSFEHAALLEPFTIAFHAVGRAPVTLDDTAVIIGCGMIGLATLQAARLAGFGQIIAIDVAPEKLELARKLGATNILDSAQSNTADEIMRLTAGRGADRVFEAVGAASTVDIALRSVRKGGSVTLIGNVTPKIDLPLQVVVTREITIHGTCASAGEYPACIDMMARGAIDPKPFLSAVAPLSEGASWFDRLYRKESGLLKVILKP